MCNMWQVVHTQLLVGLLKVINIILIILKIACAINPMLHWQSCWTEAPFKLKEGILHILLAPIARTINQQLIRKFPFL